MLEIESKENLDKATSNQKREGTRLGINSNVKNKMKPKILITNVTSLEHREEIKEIIVRKNEWLRLAIDSGEEFELVASLKAKNDSFKNFIFRCSLVVRKLMKERGDKIYTMFSQCQLYDSYNIMQCFNCQKFGDLSSKCSNRDPVCVKCVLFGYTRTFNAV